MNDCFDSNDVLFLNNSTFHDEPIKEISIIPNNEENCFSCFSVSSKKNTKPNFSLNVRDYIIIFKLQDSIIESKITMDKETYELDSTYNISTSKVKSRSSSKFSRNKFSSLGEKKKKSKFLCIKELNIKEDIEKSSAFKMEILGDNEEIKDNTTLIMPEEKAKEEVILHNDIINHDKDSKEPILNYNNQDLKNNVGSSVGITNEGKENSIFSHNLLKIQEMINSSCNKYNHDQQFINHKHNRRNDFQSYNEYINNVNGLNHINHVNQSSDINKLAHILGNYPTNNYIGNLLNISNYNFFNECFLNFQLIQNMININPNNFSNSNDFYTTNYNINSNAHLNGLMDNIDVRYMKDLERLCQLRK
jgi:hypothetical protein